MQAASDSLRSAFTRQRYAVVRALVEPPLLGFLWRYVIERADAGALSTNDPDVPGTPSVYADPVMEHVLERLRPAVEDAAGTTLFPTYSYFRLYKTGDVLERHQDREACEISVSLNLGQEPPAPWPLWISGPLGSTAVDLAPGDALIYRGIECEHWRERLDGTRVGQVFFHYVDQNGPHRAWRFDKRPSLGTTIPLPL